MNIDIYPAHKSYEPLLKNFPVVKASKFLPEWYKKNKINNFDITFRNNEYVSLRDDSELRNKHAKNCPAIQEYITNGVVIPSWTDLYISVNKDGTVDWHMTYGDASNYFHDIKQPEFIAKHPQGQIRDMELNAVENYGLLKIVSPYYFKTDKGYGLEFFDPFYHHRRNIKLLPGIVETDIWHEVNFPFEFYYSPEFKREVSYHIKAGDPLIMARPVKLEKIKSNLELHNYNIDIAETQKDNVLLELSLSGNFNRFKNHKENE